MSGRVFIRATAESDLAEIVEFIAADDPASADRVREAAIDSIRLFASNPRMGRAYRASSARLGGLRKWNVRDYPMYLISIASRTMNASMSCASSTAGATSPRCWKKRETRYMIRGILSIRMLLRIG